MAFSRRSFYASSLRVRSCNSRASRILRRVLTSTVSSRSSRKNNVAPSSYEACSYVIARAASYGVVNYTIARPPEKMRQKVTYATCRRWSLSVCQVVSSESPVICTRCPTSLRTPSIYTSTAVSVSGSMRRIGGAKLGGAADQASWLIPSSLSRWELPRSN